MKLSGIVISGSGHANKISDELHKNRCKVVDAKLIKGTLNVKIHDLEDTIETFGLPLFETDKHNQKLGPLRWWNVSLTINSKVYDSKTFIVRHYNTTTKYLEIMSEINFREDGVEDENDAIVEINKNT